MQTITKTFSKARLDVTDVKMRTGAHGESLAQYHVDYTVNLESGIIPTA